MFTWLKNRFTGSFRNSILEQRKFSLTDEKTWDEFFADTKTTSGIRMTNEDALKVAAVFQGASIISGDIAMLPLQLKRVLTDGDKEVDESAALNRLLTVKPNNETSAFEMWRRCILHTIIWGNGYLWIERRGGRIASLVNLLPTQVSVSRDTNNELVYTVKFQNRNGEMTELDFSPSQIFHLKPISLLNGIGVNPLDYARNAWALSLAAEGFTGAFFRNGANTGGILKIPLSFTKKAADGLEEGFSKRYTGEDNWFKTVILRDGAEFEKTTIVPEQAQLNALREEQVREAARTLNLPPFKLGLEDSQGFKTAEQQQIVYKTGTLQHWTAAIKAEAMIKFLSEEQLMRRTHTIEYDMSKIIEVDTETHNSVLSIQRAAAVITANEWRREIGRNRSDDPTADELFNPSTSANIEDDSSDNDNEQSEPEDTTIDAELGVFNDILTRLSTRITSDIERMGKKSAKLVDWVDSDAQKHRLLFAEIMSPVCILIAARKGLTADHVIGTSGSKYFSKIIGWIDPLLSPPYAEKDLLQNISQELTPERIDCIIHEVTQMWR